MRYLDQAQYDELNKNHDGWQRKSFENLRKSMSDDENFFTHYKISDDSQRVIYITFMNRDGIGSSRILLCEELTKAFPNGYKLAFPDRSCGLVIPLDITREEWSETTELVKRMHKGATTPMSDKLHSAEEFSLPVDWTAPIDTQCSDLFVNEINKVKP